MVIIEAEQVTIDTARILAGVTRIIARWDEYLDSLPERGQHCQYPGCLSVEGVTGDDNDRPRRYCHLHQELIFMQTHRHYDKRGWAETRTIGRDK